jgi:hypothetical protein
MTRWGRKRWDREMIVLCMNERMEGIEYRWLDKIGCDMVCYDDMKSCMWCDSSWDGRRVEHHNKYAW